MSLKLIGVVSVGMVVMLVCIKQTFAAHREYLLHTAESLPYSADLNFYFDWHYEGKENSDELGWAVSGAGDVNGDGLDDIIVGAPKASLDTPEGVDNEGIALAFYGQSQGLPYTPDWIIGSSYQGYRLGCAVSSAGDINGDGYDDVIVGAEDYKVSFGSSGDPKSGAVFLYYGSEEGLTAAPAWSVFAEAPEILLGHAVTDAGDVNGDGYDDVIIGAPSYESESFHDNEGKVYLYLGSAEGLSTTPDWIFECNQAAASCGDTVESAGDINGDGYDDVIVGAPHFDNNFDQEGAAFVFHGSSSGLSITPDWIIYGSQIGSELGSSVAGAGDVNGDGFDDVIVGAPHFSQEEADNVGATFLYHGSPVGLSLNPNWETFGLETGSLYGASVHAAGDIDRDGYMDVLVGAYLFGMAGTLDQPDEGAAYLYKGSPMGLEIQPVWMVTGGKAEAWFGHSVGGAGDVNGDGLDDVIIGAPLYRMDQRIILGRALAYYAQVTTSETFVFIPFISVNVGE